MLRPLIVLWMKESQGSQTFTLRPFSQADSFANQPLRPLEAVESLKSTMSTHLRRPEPSLRITECTMQFCYTYDAVLNKFTGEFTREKHRAGGAGAKRRSAGRAWTPVPP